MTYLDALIILAAMLQLKHWYIDFVNQTMDEVHSKGIYGDRLGLWHSAKQGIGTAACIAVLVGPQLEGLVFCVVMGLLDFLIHYHTDWAKININKSKNYTVETPQFWAWLGADQLVHQLTYLLILYITFL